MNRNDIKRSLADMIGAGMTCKGFVEIVTDYLEGSLSISGWLRFQLHLGICYGCRVYLRQMKQTVRLLGRLPSQSMPSHLRAELLDRFRTWRLRGPVA